MTYLSNSQVVAIVGNLSLQQVNLYIVLRGWLDVKGGLAMGGAPRIHTIFVPRQPRHLHLGK